MYLFLRQIYIKLANRLAELTKSSALDYKKRQAMYRMLEKMTGEPATLQINEALIELAALEVDKDKKTRLKGQSPICRLQASRARKQ